MLDWQKQFQADPPKAPQTLPLPTDLPNTPLPVGLSLEQAWATLWPFRPFKGQSMGMLVETGQISLQNLVFAVKNAWDERIRQAAIVFLMVGLKQVIGEPRPSAGVLNVVSAGRSFALRRQFFLTYVEGAVLGGALAAVICLAVFFFTRQQPTQPTKTLGEFLSTPSGIIGVILVIALCVVACWLPQFLLDRLLLNRIDRARENYRRGQEGEERVVDMIRQVLDDTWFLFQNITLPGRKADLDAVLVGPSGVWVFEVKTFSGDYRNIGDDWSYRAANRWNPIRKGPSQQARRNAARLSQSLKADHINRWVTAAVVWADPESALTVENPTVAVWNLDGLLDELGNIQQADVIPEDDRQKIVETLTKLCRRQQEARNAS